MSGRRVGRGIGEGRNVLSIVNIRPMVTGIEERRGEEREDGVEDVEEDEREVQALATEAKPR